LIERENHEVCHIYHAPPLTCKLAEKEKAERKKKIAAAAAVKTPNKVPCDAVCMTVCNNLQAQKRKSDATASTPTSAQKKRR
jgi:hypothetical protein